MAVSTATTVLQGCIAWIASFVIAAFRQHTPRANIARRFLLTVGLLCPPAVITATTGSSWFRAGRFAPPTSWVWAVGCSAVGAVLGGRFSLVGLTGGIATGKSTVSRRLAGTHGVPIIDADLIARLVVEPGKAAYAAIVRHFGAGVLSGGAGSALDRDKLGDIIFKDPAQRRALNKIVHPAIAKEIAKQFLWPVAVPRNT